MPSAGGLNHQALQTSGEDGDESDQGKGDEVLLGPFDDGAVNSLGFHLSKIVAQQHSLANRLSG
jgi:hypothetical protein